MRAKGNEGVAGLIEKSAGSIGYVGYEFARRIGLDTATLENKEGKFVKASEQSCAGALATAELPANLRAFVPDPPGADFLSDRDLLLGICCANLIKTRRPADAVRKLFQWSLQDGQRYASELGYVPLPSTVSEKALAAVNSITP